jgi:hypothetical protein
MTQHVVLPRNRRMSVMSPSLRSFWRRFVDVTFISQAAEDERLAEIERLARDGLENGVPVAARACDGPSGG